MPSPYEQIPDLDNEPENDSSFHKEPKIRLNGWIIICLSFALFSVLYRTLVVNHFEQTALMFIGLPTILAIALAASPSSSSATGRILKGMTMTFLLIGILLVEGLICILVASPLFYLIGFIIGYIIDNRREKKKKKSSKLYCSILLSLGFLSLEGISNGLSFERDETVTVKHSVAMPATDAWNMLETASHFDLEKLPGFLKLGFPAPQSITGTGLNVGAEWTIHFAGGEGQPGDLVVQVIHKDSNSVTFQAIKDTSHIAHWMTWKTVTWQINAKNKNQSDITMTMKYDRELDPAWYFKPLERYGVEKAGEYFIQETFKTEDLTR